MIAAAYIPLLIYFFLEFLRKSPVSENKGNRGSNVLIGSALVWMILIPTILYFLLTPAKQPNALLWFGLLLGLLGVWIRRSAIVMLGRFYSRNVGIQNEHRLIQTGWYRFIRHPGYLGTFLTYLGFAVSTGLWISVLVNVVLFFIAYTYRIHIEEQTMAARFGTEYKAYQKKSWRIIPLLY